jgi:hypothetical protein
MKILTEMAVEIRRPIKAIGITEEKMERRPEKESERKTRKI